MNPKSGITPENRRDPQSQQIQKGRELSFSIDFSILSDRRIGGLAHFEQADLENEIIEIDAIRKALPDFMEHPIIHYQHTERPIGTITKAEIKDKGLYIEGSIYSTPDTDDVWEEIQNGSLNKYSIYGRRLKGNDQCRIPPENRMSPCVTKAIALWSISAVGDNAINQMTFLEVMKALRGDTVTDTEEETEQKAEETPQEPELLKAEGNMSSILERISGLEETIKGLTTPAPQEDETEKAEEPEEAVEEKAEPEDEEEEKGCGCAKAKPIESDPADEIVKADVVQKAFDEFKKATETRIAGLESRIVEMEKETIQKGGQVVIIPSQMTPEDRAAINPMIQNARALGD
ncbi:MAG: hypothetical protein WCS18_12445 [Sphaerochaetaceae bacterium]